MKTLNWKGFVLLVGLMPALSGCATILRGTGHGIGIASQPPGAKVSIDNKAFGITPVYAKLKRKDNHNILIEMESYEPYEMVLTRQTSGWVFGNIFFCIGAPIGIAIDAIAGGMYTLKPDQVNAELRGGSTHAKVEDGTILVMLVPDPAPDWRKIGQLERVVTGSLED